MTKIVKRSFTSLFHVRGRKTLSSCILHTNTAPFFMFWTLVWMTAVEFYRGLGYYSAQACQQNKGDLTLSKEMVEASLIRWLKNFKFEHGWSRSPSTNLHTRKIPCAS